MNLRDIIKDNRKKLGLTQSQFCEYINAEKPTDIKIGILQLGTWERCVANCPSNKLLKIIRVLNRELESIGEPTIKL